MSPMGPELRWQWVPFMGLSSVELYSVLSLRQEVFVLEQSSPYLDADGLDFEAFHLLGWRDAQLVAYLRAFPAGAVHDDAATLGRVLTADALRGQGWGRPLINEGIRRAAETFGASPVALSAQEHLRGFYESLGFVVTGPGYDEDGIPHVPMRRPIR
jgi:ElaA protein